MFVSKFHAKTAACFQAIPAKEGVDSAVCWQLNHGQGVPLFASEVEQPIILEST